MFHSVPALHSTFPVFQSCHSRLICFQQACVSVDCWHMLMFLEGVASNAFLTKLYLTCCSVTWTANQH
jgi:hypothetical protein